MICSSLFSIFRSFLNQTKKELVAIPAVRYIFLFCHIEPFEVQNKKDAASTSLTTASEPIAIKAAVSIRIMRTLLRCCHLNTGG